MKKLLLIILLALAASPDAAGQDLSRYGSLARQQIVKENLARRAKGLERENYRRFREMVNRTTSQPQTRIVVRRRHLTYAEARYLHERYRRYERRSYFAR
jgi:hypothetical protein